MATRVDTVVEYGSVSCFRLATRRSAPRKQEEKPAANSCSGFVPGPPPPADGARHGQLDIKGAVGGNSPHLPTTDRRCGGCVEQLVDFHGTWTPVRSVRYFCAGAITARERTRCRRLPGLFGSGPPWKASGRLLRGSPACALVGTSPSSRLAALVIRDRRASLCKDGRHRPIPAPYSLRLARYCPGRARRCLYVDP